MRWDEEGGVDDGQECELLLLLLNGGEMCDEAKVDELLNLLAALRW